MRHLVLGLAGKRPGPEAITLFDGLGVAMEDTARRGRGAAQGQGAGHRDGAAHRGAVHRRAADPVGGGSPLDSPRGNRDGTVVDCRQAGTEGSL